MTTAPILIMYRVPEATLLKPC